MGSYHNIRGKQLYIEETGSATNPAILYIHGGPGGVGVTEFMAYQGDRLSAHFHVIAPDQRGVWRSEAIGEAESITLEDNIEDFEAIRRQRGIDKWTLLGHSYGAYLAVLYANLYPNSVASIVYEGPSFSFALAERHILGRAINLLSEIGKSAEAEGYRDALDQVTDFKEVQPLLDQAFADLRPHGNRVFWYDPDHDKMNQIIGSSEETKGYWKKSNYTRSRLMSDWRCYKDVFAELSQINKPSLLIVGKHDPITCPIQIRAFKESAHNNEVYLFEYSGHSVRVEEPDKYCEAVTRFILTHLDTKPSRIL